MSDVAVDAEGLIISLGNALDPNDRRAFEEAAEAALAKLAGQPHAWGPDAIHRVLEAAWRPFFRPPSADETAWQKLPNQSCSCAGAKTSERAMSREPCQRMTAEEYKAALATLGLDSEKSVARLLGRSLRMVRRYASGGWPVPTAIAVLLRIMIAHRISPDDVDQVSRSSCRAGK